MNHLSLHARLPLALLAFVSVGGARTAHAATVLFVSDNDSDTGIAGVLEGDGHTVTAVSFDPSGPTSVLRGDLSMYEAIVWSRAGFARDDATFDNLTAYVTAGGRVFYTGYDATLSSLQVRDFLGASSSYDFPSAPGRITSDDNALTTGVLDIRGVTPTGGHSDRDALTGLRSDTVSVSADTGFGGGHEWTLRSLGDGYVAWVSNGFFSGTHPSWETTTGSLGARAYNAAVRNFVYNAGGFSGTCTIEDAPCASASGRAGVCHTGQCCIGCWDGTRCYGGTSGSACGVEGGACITCSDGIACTLDVCTTGVCSNPDAPDGHPCEDGEFCTVGERCDADGLCGGGRPNDCDDDSMCTADSCDEAADRCDHVPGGTGCFIDDACYGALTLNPSNVCQMCDPRRTSTEWSPRTVGTLCGSTSCSGRPGAAMFDDGGRCDADGNCGPSSRTPCAQGVCSGSTMCSSTCEPGSCPDADMTCSTTAHVCVMRAADGRHCSVDGDCLSDHCTDGVCCSTPCDELCDSCDLPGSVGTCMPTPIGGSCGDPMCRGTSITLPGVCTAGGECTRDEPRRCPQGFCADDLTCSSTCTPDSCAADEICTEGLVCVVPGADGASCGADDHCESGYCVDGICCNRPCDDICESCGMEGRLGRCVPYTMGIDPELDCPVGSVCNGGAGCMIAPDAGTPDTAPPPRARDCACRATRPAAPTGGALGLGVVIGVAILRRRRRGSAAARP